MNDEGSSSTTQPKQYNVYLPRMESLEKSEIRDSTLRNSNLSRIINNEDILPSNQDWNDSIEYVVRDIGNKCKTYKQMHMQYAQESSTRFKRISFLSILTGPVSGVLTSIEAITNHHISILLVSSLISFISGAIAAIIKFSRYEEIITSHKSAAAKYTSLETNIRRQLALYRKDRIPVEFYLNWLSEAFDTLYISCPLIPKRIYDRYKNTDDNAVIFINKEYKEQKINELKDTTTIAVNKFKSANLNKEKNKSTDFTINFDSLRSVSNAPRPCLESTSENNESDTSCNKPSTISSSEASSQSVKGDNKVRRPSTMSLYSEFNRYNNKMMNYEIKRFFGFS